MKILFLHGWNSVPGGVNCKPPVRNVCGGIARMEGTISKPSLSGSLYFALVPVSGISTCAHFGVRCQPVTSSLSSPSLAMGL